MTESFPRQRALTRSFRLGAPRNFRLNADREIVLFIRSESGRSATGDLWCAQPQSLDAGAPWVENKLVSAAKLGSSGDIPDAERARRERMREVTEGITAFSVDKEMTRAAFSVDGELYWIELHSEVQPPHVNKLPTQGACVDPRISPDGKRIAYVTQGSVFAVTIDSAVPELLKLCGPAENEEHVSWGLADFAAAEELERMRGHWWRPDSQALFVERVDESNVQIAWISDPAHPKTPARSHKYPFAGTANAVVSLHEVDIQGKSTEIHWDHEEFPYLVTVTMSGAHPTISVLSRDQQTLKIFAIENAELTEIATRIESPWHTVYPGVPALNSKGELIEIRPIDDTFRLCINGEPVSSPDIQVSGVISTDPELVFIGSTDPTAQIVFHQKLGPLCHNHGLTSATVDHDLITLAHTDLDSTRTTYTLINLEEPDDVLHTFTNNAETPVISPRVNIALTGERQLRSAIIWPQDHVPGTKIPVICAPYGGPHFQRVIQSGLAFCSDQWLANHGFAIVVTDNRGTPSRGPKFEYEISMDLASKVLEDQVAALTNLGEQFPDLDLTRVGIHGWSFGGYLAALAVLERSDVFHAAVSGAPVTDWALYDTAYTERYLGSPQDNPAVYAQTSLLTKADGLESPLLIIHGIADDNVLFANTLQLSGSLLAAGKDHSVLPLTGVTHMTPQEIVAENLLLTELRFFQQHLQQDSPMD